MSDCRTCKFSIGADIVTVQKFRLDGYSIGTGQFEKGQCLICERHKQIAPSPCADYEREAGTS